MNGLPDQPWHAEAIRLASEGYTREAIAEAVDRHVYTVSKLFCPGIQAGNRERMRRRHHRRMQDPAWRERERERHRRRRAECGKPATTG